jgi:hypothetical protein
MFTRCSRYQQVLNLNVSLGAFRADKNAAAQEEEKQLQELQVMCLSCRWLCQWLLRQRDVDGDRIY